MARALRSSTRRAGHMIVMMANGLEVMDPITDALAICSAIWWHTSMRRPLSLRPIWIQASSLNRTQPFFRAFPKGSTVLRSLPL